MDEARWAGAARRGLSIRPAVGQMYRDRLKGTNMFLKSVSTLAWWAQTMFTQPRDSLIANLCTNVVCRTCSRDHFHYAVQSRPQVPH